MYLSWYDFKSDDIYTIYNYSDLEVLFNSSRVYDYMIMDLTKYNAYDLLDDPRLYEIKRRLSKVGRLILVGQNKIGMENLSTSKFFGSSRSEYIDFIFEIGFMNYKFYYPFPSLSQPQIIYTDERLIAKDDLYRIVDYYPNYKQKNFMESEIYMDIVDNNIVCDLNSAYIIECLMDGDFSEEIFIMQTINRKKKYAFAIKIFKDKVVKKALYKEGIEHIKQIQKNSDDLRRRGFSVLDFEIKNNEIHMEFINKPKLSDYIRRISDKKEIFRLFDRIWKDILNSSEHTHDLSPWLDDGKIDLYEVILKNAYPDMIYFNIFCDNDKFIYFDQEFVEYNLPAKYVMYRSVSLAGLFIDDGVVSMKELMDRYGITDIAGDMAILENKIWDSWYSFVDRGIDYRHKEHSRYVLNKQKFTQMFYGGKEDYLYINSLEKRQNIGLDLLSEFQKISKVNNLMYYPCFGTLLGAVRNKSVVPWDVDIDVVMLRKDYDRLISLYNSDELLNISSDYEFSIPNYQSKSFDGGYIRFINKNTTALHTKHLHKKSKDGIHMDIMPLDLAYEDMRKNAEKKLIIMDLQLSIYAKLYANNISKYYLRSDDYFMGIYERYLDVYNKIYSEFFEKSNIDVICLKSYENYINDDMDLKDLYIELNKEIIKGDINSRKVCIFTGLSENFRIFDIGDFSGDKQIEFENISLPCPNGYHNILRTLYGREYLKISSLHNRFKKDDVFLKPNVPYKSYHIRFDLSVLSNKEVIVFGAGHSFYNLVDEYSDIIPKFIVDNDSNKWGKRLKDLKLDTVGIKKEFLVDIDFMNEKYGGIKIISPKELAKYILNDNKYPIVIASMHFNEIENQIRKMRIQENYFIYILEKSWLIKD